MQNVQDGVVPKTDLEMQPIQDELSSAPEELPPKEAEVRFIRLGCSQ